MNPSHPPEGAIWLLERCSLGRRNDSLVGDLIEEFGQGQTRAWFWKQTIIALTVSFASELGRSPLLIVRAMASGWVSLYIGRFLIDGLMLRRSWPGIILPVAFDPLGYSRFRWLVFWTPVTAASGWIVSRLHRRHRILVLLFSVSVLLWDLRELPWICALVVDSFGNSRYVPYLLNDFASIIIPPAGILLGGLWSATQLKETPRVDRPRLSE
jgi:hypothetical protein